MSIMCHACQGHLGQTVEEWRVQEKGRSKIIFQRQSYTFD